MPGIPTEQLADEIHEVRRDLSALRADFAGFRAAVETELGIIRKLGTWLLGGVFGLIAALLTAAVSFGWSASEAKHQVDRIDKTEKRLDGIDAKLDTLIRRGDAARKGE